MAGEAREVACQTAVATACNRGGQAGKGLTGRCSGERQAAATSGRRRPNPRRRPCAARLAPSPQRAGLAAPRRAPRRLAVCAALKRFVIERDIPGIGGKALPELGSISAASNAALAQAGLQRVQWQHSYVTEGKTFCGERGRAQGALGVEYSSTERGCRHQRGSGRPPWAALRAEVRLLAPCSCLCPLPGTCPLNLPSSPQCTWQKARTQSGSTPRSAGEGGMLQRRRRSAYACCQGTKQREHIRCATTCLHAYAHVPVAYFPPAHSLRALCEHCPCSWPSLNLWSPKPAPSRHPCPALPCARSFSCRLPTCPPSWPTPTLARRFPATSIYQVTSVIDPSTAAHCPCAAAPAAPAANGSAA